jgi:hypothetical protein
MMIIECVKRDVGLTTENTVPRDRLLNINKYSRPQQGHRELLDFRHLGKL